MNKNLVEKIMAKDLNAFQGPVPQYVRETNKWEMFTVSHLSVRDVITASESFDQMEVSRELPWLEEFIAPATLSLWNSGERTLHFHKRYTEAFINVSCMALDALPVVARPIFKSVTPAGRIGYFQLVKDHMVDLLTGGSVECEHIFNEDGSVKHGVLVYAADTALTTAGMVKKGQIRLYCQNLDGFDAKQHETVLNYGMANAIARTMAITNKKPGAGLEKEISQAATRMSQRAASSVELGTIRSYAVYMGTFGKGFGFEHDFCDGQGFVDSKFFANAVSEKIDEEVTSIDVLGMGVQSRPYSNKTFSMVVDQKMIKRLMKGSGADGVVIIDANRVSEMDQYDFDLAVATKGREGRFANKIVILVHEGGDAYHVEYFSDLNGQKSSFDLKAVSPLNVLALGHENTSHKDEEVLSSQAFQSFALLDWEGTRKYFLDKVSESCDRFVEDFNKVEGTQLTAEEAAEVGTSPVGDLILKMYPQFVRSYRPLGKSIIQKKADSLNSDLMEVRIPASGIHGQMCPDLGAYFGVKLLKDNEFFNSYASKVKLEMGVAVKYPKMHPDEYSLPIFVSKNEYLDRAREALSAEDFKLFKTMLLTLNSSWMVIPATQTLLNLHAGSDFDGDKIFVLVEEALIRIAVKGNPTAVKIKA